MDNFNDTFGDYQIVEKLQRTALGTVYLAEHAFLKKPYMLHLIPEEVAKESGFVDRFQEEIRKIAKLDHAHILKTSNATFLQGKYFIASECALDDKGEIADLSSFLKANKKSLVEEEIHLIAEQLCSAIDYAWEKEKIAHTGINPSSIILKKGKNGLEAFIADFGLLRVAGASQVLGKSFQALAMHLTKEQAEHSLLEHFAFLSPEQKEGHPGSHKSDVFAFGVLIYFLLMGKIPQGIFEMPSQKYPNLRYHWDLLLYHCLQDDPQKRPDRLSTAFEALETEKTILPSILNELKPVIKPAELARPEFIADPAALFITDTTVGRYQPKEEEKKNIEPLRTEMVIVNGGQYQRGSSTGGRDEIPKHSIQLDSFALDIHPVTNEQFVRFLEAMGGEKDVNNNDMIRLRDSRIKRSGGKINIESGYAKHPVVGVSWYGSVAYAKWVGKRLPTEAEWEIAASAGLEDHVYPTGQEIDRSDANFFSSDTTPVMSYKTNALGLYDMAGNVYEWCQDWYDFHYYDISIQEPNNPVGPHQGTYRVLRGGCWKSLKDDLRCSHRHRNNPGTMNGTYGFRCAADVG